MWFTIGFSAACGLSAWVLWACELWLFAVTALMLGGITVILGKRRGVWFPAAILLGCAAGFFWFGLFQMNTLNPILETDGKALEASIRVRDFSYETEYGTALDGILSYEEKDYKVRVYLDEHKEIQPGDTLSGTFRFRITAPGGGKEATYHSGRSILLLLYQKGDAAVIPHGERNIWERVSLFRRDLTGILEGVFPEDTMPFAKALLIGDTSDLGCAVDWDMKISGIRHVAAVSGLHVSILFALVTAVTLKQRFLTALVGIIVLVLFGALAGFTPSVTRACLMCFLMLLARVLNRGYDSATALSFAVLVMLAVNPLVITDTGFQLSVGSVAGIYLFANRLQEWLTGRLGKGWLTRGIAASVSATLSAMAVTTPLSAWYFGTVSLIGVATNLLTLWVISFIFYGILAAAFLALFWQSAAVWLAGLVSWPIRYVLWTAEVLAEVPLAAVYTRSGFVALWLAFSYLLLALFLLGKGRGRDLVCCMVLSLCLCLLPCKAALWRDEVRFTALDVGQGQCLIFQSGGKTVMVDCGGDNSAITADRASQALLSQGIGSLDALILTHWDKGHAGAAARLLSRVETKLLILPAVPPEESLSAGETLYAYEPLCLAWEGAEIQIFPGDSRGNPNEKSLCVLFDTKKCDILIASDRNFAGGQALLNSAKIGRVDVLAAGHHSAAGGISPELLRAVRPQAVCISAGKDNPYGHPAPETLKQLEDFGCQVFRTDLQGDIIIRR